MDQDFAVHVMTIKDLIYLNRQQKKSPKGQLQSQHEKEKVAPSSPPYQLETPAAHLESPHRRRRSCTKNADSP
jgi:hypothetical protein